MQAKKLAGLQPASVFDYFEQLCAIPRGSGNTKAVSDYLVAFAKAHGLRYEQDDLNNVIIFADGTPGYEDHAPVILQGHMDIVCEKDADCPIDMQTQGVDVAHDGEFVFANGTTLGADNGIAVAYALALLDDPSIPHPPLEVIITSDEETGMYGALGIDLSSVKGRIMLNMDSTTEGCFTVSCAGGARADMTMAVAKRAVYGPCVRLTVDGLRGGHSGGQINKPYANANKMMGELLDRVQKQMPLCLTRLEGGDKDNAIPRRCEATFVAMGMNLECINEIAQTVEQEIRQRYDEPDVRICGDNVEALGGNALSTQDTAKLIRFLCEAPHGVQEMSKEIEDHVQTSLNFAVVHLGEEFSATFSVRSSVDSEKQDLVNELENMAKSYDASFSVRGEYPAWEYRKESVLRDTMVSVYQSMYGVAPQVHAVHAGLECGPFSKKLPGLDCVAMGPNSQWIHTPRERLDIASTKRTWEFIQEVLKAL